MATSLWKTIKGFWESGTSYGIDKGLAWWMLGPTKTSGLNLLIHMVVIEAGAAMSLLGLHTWAKNASLLGFGNWDPEMASMINAVLNFTSMPNLEGIVIQSSVQRCTRDIDVSEMMLVGSGGSALGKEYVTDNAAPHPREWTISGHITAFRGTPDIGLNVKPTLSLQLLLLDRYSKLRVPLYFKPYYNLFVKVLVKNFTYEFEPNVMNGVKVDLTLREFVAYEVDSMSATLEAVKKAGEEGSNQ
jgi:hypothetical protein